MPFYRPVIGYGCHLWFGKKGRLLIHSVMEMLSWELLQLTIDKINNRPGCRIVKYLFALLFIFQLLLI